jgi:putative redox protein
MEITFEGSKVVTAYTHGHAIRTDQPIDNGGGNSAPSPFDLFLASIGTCAGIYVKSFCDKRGISTEGIKLVQRTVFNEETDLPTSISIDIQVPESFPDKYLNSLISVAELCKVKKTMLNPPVFDIITSKI